MFRGKNYQNNWILTGKALGKGGKVEENFLPKMVWVGSAQHLKIKGKASPYDGNHLYWPERTEKYSGFSHRISKLIRIQKGCYNWCDKSFIPMDIIKVDYITPRSKNGSDRYKNLQALHKHCHIQKSHFEKSVSIN
jgi:RNA-directed DNA polymerase